MTEVLTDFVQDLNEGASRQTAARFDRPGQWHPNAGETGDTAHQMRQLFRAWSATEASSATSFGHLNREQSIVTQSFDRSALRCRQHPSTSSGATAIRRNVRKGSHRGLSAARRPTSASSPSPPGAPSRPSEPKSYSTLLASWLGLR